MGAGSFFEIVSTSPERTKELGRNLASLLKAGDVINLTGDLGAGKTCFTQGVAKGLGIKESITSPTFNLIKEYQNRARLPLYHFDVFRLDSPGALLDLGYEEYFYGSGVTVIEWGDKISSLLPQAHLRIEFRRGLKEEERKIKIFPRGLRWKNLVKEDMEEIC